MPALPGADVAVIDLTRLAAYALNPGHPRGRDKARVFRAALGIGLADAAWLKGVILTLLPAAEAVAERVDQ